MNNITYVDNTKILNEKRRLNAIKLIDDSENEPVVIQDLNDNNRYAVRSSKNGQYYEVMFLNAGKFCNCVDYTMNCDKEGFKCKHIQVVEIQKESKNKIIKGVLNL